MKLTELIKARTPFGDARRKLRAAIDAGRIAEDEDASAAFELVFDSLDRVELVLALEELGGKTYLSPGTVRDLLWGLDRLDRSYLREHEK